MATSIHLDVHQQQSLASSYVLGALRPRRGLAPGQPLASISLSWLSARVDPRHLHQYRQARRLPHDDEQLPFLYPLAMSFPLHVKILTHPQFPLRYIRMLHVRCHVSRYAPLPVDAALTICCGVRGQRVLEGGLEVDVQTSLALGDDPTLRPLWENVNVYYFPGRYGEPDAPSGFSRLSALRGDRELASWHNRAVDRWRFARLSGDLNGLHFCRPYARLLGYERDFSHAQAIFSDCLKRMPPSLTERTKLRLDAYLKGPVYYGRDLTLKGNVDSERARFDLYCGDNPRPSVAGELYAIQGEGGLI